MPSRPVLTLAFACSLLLAGCETPADAKKAKTDPVSLQKEMAPVPAHDVAPDDKISKLEQQVADLQKEVAANRPKIAKIDVMEQKFKDLSLGLDKIDATYNMKAVAVPAPVTMPTPAPAPVMAPPPVVQKETPVAPVPVTPPSKPAEVKKPEVAKAEPVKPTAAGEKIVKDLRIGEKPEYSRFVFDLGQTVKITYDIDNDEKILVVDIPGFKWAAAKTKTFPKSVLIESYQVQEDDKGSHLMVQLRKPAKITNYSNIEAVPGKLPRAVLDISGQ